MPFIINGKTYPSINDANVKGLTMAEQMMIEREFKKPLEKIFAGLDISDKAFKSLSEDKQNEIILNQRTATFIAIWVARVRSGEKLSFMEAIDVELDGIEIVDDADPLDSTTPPSSE